MSSTSHDHLFGVSLQRKILGICYSGNKEVDQERSKDSTKVSQLKTFN